MSFEVPLSNDPEQLFRFNAGGASYEARVIFNYRSGMWSISLATNGAPLVSGVPMLSGIDIFRQYNIGIKNVYMVNVENIIADPTSSGLGSVSKMIIFDDGDIDG